nr:DinB family protein [Actinopolymorpha rutila]
MYDAVRHNAWATRQLIAFCQDQDLTEDQLVNATGVGTFGGILATLHHIVTCDGSYVRRLAQRELAWADSDTDGVDLSTLASWAADAEQVWEGVLAEPIDVERVVVIDDGLRECRAGILLAQALNHANHHREQVCAILTGLGIQPPDIPDEQLDAPIELSVEGIDDEPTPRSLLSRLIGQLDMWTASFEGCEYDLATEREEPVERMRDRLARVGPAFLTHVREMSEQGRLDEAVVCPGEHTEI